MQGEGARGLDNMTSQESRRGRTRAPVSPHHRHPLPTLQQIQVQVQRAGCAFIHATCTHGLDVDTVALHCTCMPEIAS